MKQELIKAQKENCLNCGAQLRGGYCHECGQKSKDIQLSFFKILKNFFDEVTFFDNKIFATLKLLVYHPAKLTQEYIDGKRMSYVPPFRIYLFLSSVYFIFAISNLKEGIDKIALQDNPELVSVMNDSTLTKDLDLKFDLQQKDSIQLSNEDWLNKKWNGITTQIKNNPQESLNKLTTAFSEKLPYLLYLSLPALAFFLWLFYWRKTKSYYVNHFIFSLYLFSSVFFYLIMENIVELVINLFRSTPFSFGNINFILFGIFPFTALYLFYKQSLLKTLLKFLLLALFLSSYMFVLLLILFVASIISL